MPYTAKGKCVYRKDTGKKVGCTKGSVKKYLAALHANVKDVNESEEFDWVENIDSLEFIKSTFKDGNMEYGQLVNGSYTLSVEVPEETNYSYYEEKSIQKELRRRIGVDCYFSMARGGDDELLISITVDSKEELVKVIDWVKSDNNLHESEEFDWVEIPKLPKDNDFISSVKYALEGSLYDLHLYTTGQLVNRDYHLVNLAELRKGNQTLFKKDLEYFTPENVKKEFDDVFTNIKNQEKMLGPGSMSHNPERFPDLSSKMGKVHKLYFDAYELLKDLLPKDGLNESEEWYDEVLNKKPLLRFDDLMVGDVINIDPEHEHEQPNTYLHVLSFEDGKTWRNAYEETEKYVVCSLVKEDPGTGNFIPVSRTDIKFPRGKNVPMWTLIYREGIVESIKESEDEFEWVNDIKLTLGFDDLKLGDVVRLKDYDNNNWEVIDIYMSDPSMTGRPSEKRIKFRIPFRNSYLELWKSPLNSENYFELVNRNPDRVYFNVNESEDDFDWIQDLTKYLKVGQEFSVTRQSGGEPFNAKIIRLKTKTNPLYTVFYFIPSSMAKHSTKLFGTPMTAQKLLELMELGYWTPIERNINESEDDFEWAQETIKNSFLEFNGKEIMIDIQGLDTEELKRLYDIVIPFAQIDSSWFTTHEGEEIIWQDNTKCFENMLRDGVGNKKSISLHCGLEDNDYLPLKGAICCLKGTYDDEPSYSKENIIPVNAREIIGGTINESEWFEDVVKDPIMLKVEELEMGDIVIPTRFNQQEYIVTGKGTSVKLLHAPTHWVTLKRNTKENTGGVYIEHDSEIGKACRFELIHREENLNESEEDSELFWAQDLLKGVQESVDITDKLDIMEELPAGSILKLTGYQDEMEFGNDEVKLIDKAEDQDYQSTYYLFKLKKERWSDGSEMTHCGNTPNHRKICECREGTEIETGQTEVGKCWWIELKKQDQVLYYPNRIDLTENKKKKPFLTEGRYDAITRKVVRDIMKAVTEGDSDNYNLPSDISNEQDEYEQDNLSFSLELDIVRTDEVDSFEVKTAIADDEENIIMMSILMGPNFSSQKLQSLFYKLQEDIRHEIEHFTQMGPNRIKDRPTYRGSTANLKTTYGHHKNVIEVPALVHGFYRRAKLEKRPIDEIMMDDLDVEIERGLLTKNQAQKLLTLWLDYAKKNLPAAVYKKN